MQITRSKGLIFFLFMIIGILVALGAWMFFGTQKAIAQVEIISVLSAEPKVGDTVRVNFKVQGGAEDFTIIALPDTQHYSDVYPELYYAQTQWIADNIDDLNIVFVTHLGDIVQNRDQDESEWIVADTAMGYLDGVVPYGVLPGNHDMEAGGIATYYTKYFPAARFEENAWWGGDFNENRDNYQLFSAGGDDYIIVHLQFCPSDEALDWANEVLVKYPERRAIISTHSYLNEKAERVGICKPESDGDNNGIHIWNKLIRPNSNIFLVLSGHIPGAARRVDSPNGIPVYQLLADYQDDENHGNGYLRIMQFHPQTDTLQVSTYSPAVDGYLSDPENQFELDYEMTGGEIPKGSVIISNGTDECTAPIEQGYCELTWTVSGAALLTATYSGDTHFKGSQIQGFEINP